VRSADKLPINISLTLRATLKQLFCYITLVHGSSNEGEYNASTCNSSYIGCKSALEREAKLLEHSIERTRQALVPYTARYGLSSDEFERKFKAREVDETLDYLDWWMEIEALRHLEAQRASLREAKLD